MAPGYGISAISPFGNIGLGASGAYSSYDPYMMSNYYGGGYINPADTTMYNMYNMYNPTYWTQLQQQVEKSQLNHANYMHAGLKSNEVSAHRASTSALIDKIITNGGEKREVENLYQKVKEGDLKGACDQFDVLKNTLLRRYSTEFEAMGDKINKNQEAAYVIEQLYNNIISAQTGEIANLRQDIERYGDGALMNGFMQGFKTDHHNMYVDEALNHCFGLRIDQKGAKDHEQAYGKLLGGIGQLGKSGVLGLSAAAAISGVAGVTGKCFLPESWKTAIKNCKIGTKTPFANASTWNFVKKSGKAGLFLGLLYGGYKIVKSWV